MTWDGMADGDGVVGQAFDVSVERKKKTDIPL